VKETSKQRQGVVKFDPDTAKTLPISTNRKRTKAWSVEREYNGLTLSINASESLNGYDLIALFQMLDDYSKNNEQWTKTGEIQLNQEAKRVLAKRTFDLKELCRQRGILTKKANRKTIAESFRRWYQAELVYNYNDKPPIHTRYIFEYQADKDYKTMSVVTNTNFLNFCLQNGMAMDWGRLTKYGKSYYGLQLDIYLQFRAIRYSNKTKKYAYPNVVKEETLFKHLGINAEVKEIKHKREKVKQAFRKFKEITGVKYSYDPIKRTWIKKGKLPQP